MNEDPALQAYRSSVCKNVSLSIGNDITLMKCWVTSVDAYVLIFSLGLEPALLLLIGHSFAEAKRNKIVTSH